MAHDLAITEAGDARMAYKGKDPWHRLGTQVRDGDNDLDGMLAASQTGFTVKVRPVIACDDNGQPLLNPDGTFVYITNSRATVAEELHGMTDDGSLVMQYNGLATVGTRYQSVDNRVVAERAQTIVAASNGSAVWETMGALDGGRRFFGCIDLGTTVLDVRGTEDALTRYLAVLHSHDGTTPVVFIPTNVRIVCANTEALALRSAKRKFKTRHTINGMAFSDDEARKALDISADFAEAFKLAAEELIRVDADEAFLRKVIAEVWPVDEDASDTIKKNAEEREGQMMALWTSERNAGGFDACGWIVLNTIGEWLDHHRSDDVEAMALTSMNPDSWVTAKKLEAHRAILSLAS